MTADNVLPCCNAQIIATVRQNSYRHLTFVRTGQTDLLVSSINLFHSKFLLTTFVKMMSPFSIGGISSLFPSGRAPSWCSSLEHFLSLLKLMCRLEGPGSCPKRKITCLPSNFINSQKHQLTIIWCAKIIRGQTWNQMEALVAATMLLELCSKMKHFASQEMHFVSLFQGTSIGVSSLLKRPNSMIMWRVAPSWLIKQIIDHKECPSAQKYTRMSSAGWKCDMWLWGENWGIAHWHFSTDSICKILVHNVLLTWFSLSRITRLIKAQKRCRKWERDADVDCHLQKEQI